jgi:hypothetical protein
MDERTLYEEKRRKQVTLMRSIMDYGMGVALLAAGLFFFFRNQFKMPFNNRYPPDDIDKIFGVIAIMYGVFRIWRGYQKKYFK